MLIERLRSGLTFGKYNIELGHVTREPKVLCPDICLSYLQTDHHSFLPCPITVHDRLILLLVIYRFNLCS